MPDILIIMSDQHSKYVLGCAGDPTVRTPHLDSLASQGTRFANAYCASPLCVPSRMSFMTGRYPSGNNVWNNQHILSSAIPTWAHVLGAAGYETDLIGRMHFVGSDQRHGFEFRPLGEYSARYPGTPEEGGPRWQKFPGSTSGQSRASIEIAGTGTTTYQWFDNRVTEATCDFLVGKANEPNRRPFAAVAGYVLPHCPFIAPADLFEHYYDKLENPVVEEKQPATIRRYRELRGILDPPLDAEKVRVARAAYYALCEYFDAQVGRVMQTLEETGLADDTLVVYCSDHGEMAGTHGCWWKSNYYEGSAGVPLILRHPKLVPAGRVENSIVNLVDVAPTLAEYAGCNEEAHPAWDGKSLAPVMRGEDNRNQTFSELVDTRGGTPNFPSRMIRSDLWKLWEYADAAELPPALFNLEEDPRELHDLGTDPGYSVIRNALLDELYATWDPAQASTRSVELNQDLAVLSAWGNAVRPKSPDALAAPPPSIEEDVRLL